MLQLLLLQKCLHLALGQGPVWDHLRRAKVSILAEECHNNEKPVVA